MSAEVVAPRRNRDGNNPPIRGGGKRKNRDLRKRQRRADALARAAARAERSDADQLAKLQAEGHGHCAEARRLAGGEAA